VVVVVVVLLLLVLLLLVLLWLRLAGGRGGVRVVFLVLLGWEQ